MLHYTYKYLIRPILFSFNPEFIHNVFIWKGQILGNCSISRKLINVLFGYKENNLAKTVDGIYYRTPFILGAGFDYNAKLMKILPSIGLGGEEVGSITKRKCAGNKKPRLTRLVKSQSIVVNKGLKNDGVDTIIKRLKTYKIWREKRKENDVAKSFVAGVSIARTNDEESVSLEAGIEDYFYSFKRLNEENVGDYYTLNISCPNAFGGETFARYEYLDLLLKKITSIPCPKPIYVKLPINRDWKELQPLIDLIIKYKLSGIIIGNLNKDYSYLGIKAETPDEYAGGLSGMPCRDISTDLIKKTREYLNIISPNKHITLIGVGGIFNAKDAKEKMEAGADLLQIVTGLIYEGPSLVKEIATNS